MRNAVTTAEKNAEPPAVGPMRRFLERIMPGTATVMVELRERLLAFALNPATDTLLIRGPSGAGKSTAARAVAALVRVAMLTEHDAERILTDLKIEGGNLISARSLIEWYVELPLTGLVESIADVQLFGSVKSAFTGAADTAGIFEKAARGRQGNTPVAAQLTGGVVFLDEIGDVPPVLQAKLLAILSGGSVYRVGAEGDADHAIEFGGTVISATWKSLDPVDFRPDLLARIAGTEVILPGLGERTDDLSEIILSVANCVMELIRVRVESAGRVEPDRVDKTYWLNWSQGLQGLGDHDLAALSAVDWTRYGHMRGLTAAIRQIIVFRRDVSTVLRELPIIGATDPSEDSDHGELFDRLLRRSPDGSGIASHLRALTLEDHRTLRGLLEDPARRQRLARSLGIPEARVRTQAMELGRSRRRGAGDPG